MKRSGLTAAMLLAAAAAPALGQNCELHFEAVAPFQPFDFGVEALRVMDVGAGGELFIGGHFTNIGATEFNKVARFNGESFQPLGLGLHPYVENFIGCCSKAFTFAQFDDGSGPAVFVGGDFVTSWDNFPNSALLSVSRWRPATGAWESLGGLINNDNCVFDCPPRVHDTQVIQTPGGPALVIGGTFSVLGFFTDTPVSSKYVGMWTSTGWVGMAGGMSVVRPENPEPAAVFALELFDAGTGPLLYAAGHFTHAGGAPADSIARWTGTGWEALPGGGIGPNGDEPPRGQINAMTVFNGNLIVGGEFTVAGAATVSHIARWDGSQWHDMGGGVDAQVRTLAVWDDGNGEALYVGGDFTVAGGRDALRLAKWDGNRWSQVLDGLDGSPYALAAYNNEFYIGGYFGGSSSVVSPFLIKLTDQPCCPPDYNGDGAISVQDIFDFLAGYFGQDPEADFNGDGNLSVQDIFDFLAAYFTGCDT